MSDDKLIARKVKYSLEKLKRQRESNSSSNDSDAENGDTRHSSDNETQEIMDINESNNNFQESIAESSINELYESFPEDDSVDSEIDGHENNGDDIIEEEERDGGTFFNINFNKLGESELDTKTCLRLWSLHFGLTEDAVNSLLNILVKKENLDLPLTKKTLVRTPRDKITLEPMDQSGDPKQPGQFYYFGIQSQIEKLNYKFLKDPSYDKISLDVGIDGMGSIAKASPYELWPILIGFNDKKNIPPIVVAAYWGKGKPKSSNQFLQKFVNEINELSAQGGIVVDKESQERKIFEIHHFGADAPAKSFIKNVQGHTGHNSCNFCNGTVETINIQLRTGDSQSFNVSRILFLKIIIVI
jgi:hypothetical protein